MGRRRFQGHSGQHHQLMGRLGVFFLLMVAVRVWPLFLRPRGHIPAWRAGGLPGCPGPERGWGGVAGGGGRQQGEAACGGQRAERGQARSRRAAPSELATLASSEPGGCGPAGPPRRPGRRAGWRA